MNFISQPVSRVAVTTNDEVLEAQLNTVPYLGLTGGSVIALCV